MRRLLNVSLVCTVTAILVLFASCSKQSVPSQTGNPSLQPVKVMLSWSPVSEHAFLYYGRKKGFFSEDGLNLTVLPSRGSTEVAKALDGKAVDFGFISGDVLVLSRIRGMRIRALATTLHNSPTTVYSLAEANIKTPPDLRHKRIGVLKQSSVYPQFMLMLKLQGIDPTSIIEIPTAGSPQEILSGNIQAALHYTHLTPVFLRTEGHQPNEILLKDWGVDVVSSSLATTDDMIDEHPDIVGHFVNAFLRSLDESATHPEESLQALLEAERSLLPKPTRASLERANELIYSPEAKKFGPGYVSIDDWSRTQKTLRSAGQIDNTISPEYFFTDQFYDNYRKTHKF